MARRTNVIDGYLRARHLARLNEGADGASRHRLAHQPLMRLPPRLNRLRRTGVQLDAAHVVVDLSPQKPEQGIDAEQVDPGLVNRSTTHTNIGPLRFWVMLLGARGFEPGGFDQGEGCGY
ncbi:MAG: hypothetical protein ACKOAF_00420 [Actinomycetes bacterium]